MIDLWLALMINSGDVVVLNWKRDRFERNDY